MSIINLKEKFEPNEWEMIKNYLSSEDKGKTWFEVAKKYNIKPEGTKDQRRKSANDVWRKFIKLVNRQEVEIKNPKILTFDIETSYNIVKAFRLGRTYLNHTSVIEERKIISIAYKWLHEDEAHVLSWDKDKDDKKLLEEFIPVLNGADEIVGHNIDRYDIPFILARAIYHRIPALAKYKTFDTCKVARRRFGFNSNKLDFIAEFLGYGRKKEHAGISMWDDIILRDDREALDEMIDYNIHDVILTEKIYLDLKNYCEAGVHHTVLNGGDKHACPECASEEAELLKTFVTKAGTKSRLMLCECGTQFKLSDKVYTNNYVK